jgi:hypothetical protein
MQKSTASIGQGVVCVKRCAQQRLSSHVRCAWAGFPKPTLLPHVGGRSYFQRPQQRGDKGLGMRQHIRVLHDLRSREPENFVHFLGFWDEPR